MTAKIVKRDGRIVPFDQQKITTAIARCYKQNGADVNGSDDYWPVKDVVASVVAMLPENPTVEDVQDVVIQVLAAVNFDLALSYANFRAARAMRRAQQEMDNDFPTQLQQLQFYSKYARFDPELGRRETWTEAVDRAMNFMIELSEGQLSEELYDAVREGILNHEVMPSMRLMAMAGPAARRNHLALYNCSYLPISDITAFKEVMILSMSGCGVGYSVEAANIDRLPPVADQEMQERATYTVEDTSEGWADALEVGMLTWWSGGDIEFDFSQVRPAGAVLRTKGGRASGPGPLKDMLNFIRGRILRAQGRQLTPLEAHDIACKIGDGVVQGGVRRTALISLFDEGDEEMLNCKTWENIQGNEQRWNANNSVVLTGRVERDVIADIMHAMHDSGGGEPGIFSRWVAETKRPARREGGHAWGTNPCGEISLRPYELCNLSVVVARPDDTFETLKRKVELAVIIGTIQSMGTYFPGMRQEWQVNGIEERLLGVDITGQHDCPVLREPGVMTQLREVAVASNRKLASYLGINQSASVTCVKPSGNSSVLLDCAPGLHARKYRHYIRRLRLSATSPLLSVLRHAGVEVRPENGQEEDTASTFVVSFPVKAPEGAVIQDEQTAMQQLEWWLKNKKEWTEHNPSCTITYDANELEEMIDWLFENQEWIGGLSFLPRSDVYYEQMPYEEITEEQYEEMNANMPVIDFSLLVMYESDDMTDLAQEIACVGGACEF